MATHAASVPATSSPGAKLYAAAGLLGAGAAATFSTVWLVWHSEILAAPHSSAILRGLSVLAWIGAGTYIWWGRPASRLGPLVAGAGFVFATTSLFASSDPFVHTLGRLAVVLYVLYFSYVALAFPGDRLLDPLGRRLMSGFAAASTLLWLLIVLAAKQLPPGGAFNDCHDRCPTNPLRVVDASSGAVTALKAVTAVVTTVAIVGIVALLVRKARSRIRLPRRAVEPVLYGFALVGASYLANTIARPEGAALQALRIVTAVASILLPLTMVAGQARARAYAAASLNRLVIRTRGERVTPQTMQELLQDALGDPSLELALWEPMRSRFVRADGGSADMSEPAPGRMVSRIAHDGRPVAALEHSAALDEAAGVVDGLAETALMLLENTRLVDELRASRARIVASADQERHRLERDLHDGAQQRLFLLQVKLARLRRTAGDGELAERIKEIEVDASTALDELRVLAHGIYPTVLVERGVPEALRAFALDAPVSVRVVDHELGRCSPIVEAAVYFCALEAIQNASKHGGSAVQVTVELARDGDRLEASIADDGDGFHGAGDGDGIGLMTMRDRIGAIGGQLEIASKPGAGATVRVSVPEAPLRGEHEAGTGRWQSA